MKKSILALSLAGAFLFSSCESEVTVDQATLKSIVDQAVAAALAGVPTVDQNAIATAAAQAAAAAVAAGFEGQDIDAAVAAAVAAAEAAANVRPDTLEHEGLITSNEIWYAETEHFLNDKVVVTDGVTLKIMPGAVIKGRESATPEDAAALVVARGGRIIAEGTADAPIIFTSEKDNLNGNLTSEDKGLWGGVIVLGKAKVSIEGDFSELQIEGIPAEDTYGLYGGSDDSDNSGVIKYVSIRHGGANIGEGNEINGLTCGGVGSGTSIANVEVYANKDDGIEMFGGKVNITNALVWHVGDDYIDTDQAYSGTIDNIVIVKDTNPNSADIGDHGFELDGAEGSYQASNPTYHTLKNITYKGGAAGKEIADLRDGVRVKIENLYAFGLAAGEDIEIDDTIGSANYAAGTIIFKDLEFNDTRAASTFVVDKSGSADVAIIQDDFVTVTAQTTGRGADTSVFTWTLYKIDF
jgi:hypothetical protein